MEAKQRIRDLYNEFIQTQIASVDLLSDSIQRAGDALVQALLGGHKIMTCGIGGSAGVAQLMAAALINRLDRERPSLPAISLNTDGVALSSVAEDQGFNEAYAKQVRALGQAGDVLVALSTSGNARSVIAAMEAALSRDMLIIALTGKDGGSMAGLLGPHDVEIRAPSNVSARIQESHLFVVHCLCDHIDRALFGTPGN
ncbi:SIS domain-containing protein [Permianibacter aggregans]|uniref:Phosphoheptose isomerase n=1 Tax=Permianibacter aggregans TaxID=1510150 RepID=A0A4V3D709_9GAMM|nr:SIS domain-containing protein [Permianibacter aggregans]QGX39258.1 SIS domain-containing protein [Permianibacter aggregans]TDQ46067.1 phosphoheptose isomerase [Permianibacter aggregans]